MRNSAFRTVTTKALGVKVIIFVKSALVQVLWRERHKNFEPFTPIFWGLAPIIETCSFGKTFERRQLPCTRETHGESIITIRPKLLTFAF
jgi:hypothetical protein